jgi:putative nucleotidyltransferase with HDIG domain
VISTDYRHDHLPLDDLVQDRMRTLGISNDDQEAIWSLLAPLGTKREGGHFHRLHSLRVGLLADEIAAEIGADQRALLFAGLLHDVGKALVPACTLCATESWTDADRAAMEQHVMDGFRLLRDRFDFTAHVIVWHHRFQRGGYPQELPAALQPFSEATLAKAHEYGKLLMVADVYDAMHRINSATGGRALAPEEIEQRMMKLHPELLGDLVPRLYEVRVLR